MGSIKQSTGSKEQQTIFRIMVERDARVILVYQVLSLTNLD